MTALDKKILARKKQAEERHILEKAEHVARSLGEFTSHGSISEGEMSSEGKFHNKYFDISIAADFIESSDGEACGGSHNVNVIYHGNTVFESTLWDVKTYLPGAWEKALGKLDEKANVRDAANEKKAAAEEKKRVRVAEAKKAKDARDHFGL